MGGGKQNRLSKQAAMGHFPSISSSLLSGRRRDRASI